MIEDFQEEIYKLDKMYEKNLARLKKRDTTDKNIKDIITFMQYGQARSLSKHRLIMYARYLGHVGELIGNINFKQAKKEDIQRVFAKLNGNYSDQSLETYKNVLKCFYRWLYELDSRDPLPDALKWLKGSRPPSKIKRKDLLTEKEVSDMIQITTDLQYKTMLAVLYEGALRPSELLSLKIDNVEIKSDHVSIYVVGKQARKLGERRVFLINSASLLKEWLAEHPKKGVPNAPVFISKTGKPFTVSALLFKVKTIAKQAGIKKQINTYRFRHSRATQIQLKYGDTITKKVLGHAKDSKATAIYSHINDEDVLDALRGKRTEEPAKYLHISKPVEDLNRDMIKEVFMDLLNSLGFDVKNLEQFKN